MQKATVGLNRGGGESGVGRRGKENAVPIKNRITTPTLADAGIDKKLSARARNSWLPFLKKVQPDAWQMAPKRQESGGVGFWSCL